MNAADTAIAAGFSELLAAAGDSVTLRGVSVSAVVDWLPMSPGNPNGQFPDFDRKAISRVEIPDGALTVAPKVGEVILTSGTYGSRRHRIKAVIWNGYAWLCECEVVA